MSLETRVYPEHDDLRARFARRHLATREERAAYLALSWERSKCWSVPQIAEREHADTDEIQRALAAFEEAGIVESTASPQGRRYRLRSEMNYLFGEIGYSPPWDPVCGMPVSATSPYVGEDVHGRTRQFCSSLCRAAFLAFRGTFSGPAPEVDRSEG